MAFGENHEINFLEILHGNTGPMLYRHVSPSNFSFLQTVRKLVSPNMALELVSVFGIAHAYDAEEQSGWLDISELGIFLDCYSPEKN